MVATTTYFLPKLLHVLPAACHFDNAWIESRSEAWIRKHSDQLFGSVTACASYIRYRISWWPCLCYPHGSADRIIEICNFTHAITVYDDLYSVLPGQQVHADLVGSRSGNHTSDAKVDQLKGIVVGRCPEDPYALAIYEVWQTIAQQMTASQIRRFLTLLQTTIDALVAEAEIRAAGQVIDVEAYLSLRMVSIWAGFYILFTEYALGIELPTEALTDPRLAELHAAFAENMVFVNDVLSYPMELSNGDWLMNSITQLVEGKGINLQDAIDEVARRAEQAERRFVAIRDELLAGHLGAQPGVRAYLMELGYPLSGSFHFQRLCPRYRWEEGAWDGLLSGQVTVSANRVKVSPLSPS